MEKKQYITPNMKVVEVQQTQMLCGSPKNIQINESLGVGYELAYAEKHGKPCHIFYDRTKVQLSAMLTGDPYFIIHPYSAEEEIYPVLDTILRF